MDYQVIDNFLHPNDFETLKNTITFNKGFPFYISDTVAFNPTQAGYLNENDNWNWFATNTVYHHYSTNDKYFHMLNNMFMPKFEKLELVKALIRIKINFYPHTPILKEHGSHVDFDFSHKAAVYSLNTCDGFTRMSNGDKVGSVDNRIVIFDGSQLHNSSTTTNAKGRFNIAFNWL